MIQHAEQKVSALPDDELIETRYKRLGHINEGKVSDKLSIYASSKLKGDVLPKRWAYINKDRFIKNFGAGGKWSKTASYHCFLYDGEYVFRIWTDSGKEEAQIDISPKLYSVMLQIQSTRPIPPGSLRKCKPMTHRITIKSESDMDVLISSVKKLYKEL